MDNTEDVKFFLKQAERELQRAHKSLKLWRQIRKFAQKICHHPESKEEIKYHGATCLGRRYEVRVGVCVACGKVLNKDVRYLSR